MYWLGLIAYIIASFFGWTLDPSTAAYSALVLFVVYSILLCIVVRRSK